MPNIPKFTDIKSLIANMKSIQEILNDATDSSITWADVSNSSISDIYKDMGYKIGQLPDGSWGMVKSTTPVTETVALGGPTLTEIPINDVTSVVISNVAEGTGSTPSPVETTMSSRFYNRAPGPEAAVGAGPIILGTIALGAFYMGYKFIQNDYEADEEYWNDVFNFMMPTVSSGASLIDSLGNIWVKEDVLDRAYEKFSDISSDGLWRDSEGDPLPLYFTRSIYAYIDNPSWLPGIKRLEKRWTLTDSNRLWGLYLKELTDTTYLYGALYSSTDQTSALVGKEVDTYIRDDDTSYTVEYDIQDLSTALPLSQLNVTLGGTLYYYKANPQFVQVIGANAYTTNPGTNLLFTLDNLPTNLNGVTPPGHSLEEIANATHPVSGGSIATTYPAWYARSKVFNGVDTQTSLEDTPVSDLTGERYLPVMFPNETTITNADAQFITDLMDGTYPVEDQLENTNADIAEKILTDQQEQTTTQVSEGVNPTTPTPINTGTTTTPSAAVPVAGGETTGMVAIYHPSRSIVGSFSRWLWSADFIDNIKKIFQDPMSAIISLHLLYATPTDAGSQNIVVGYLDTNIASPYVQNTVITIDCGSVNVPEYYNNALDYDAYTDVDIYLPFVGFRKLSTNDVMGKAVNVTYNIDVITGTCVAFIYVDGRILYSFGGNCAVEIPISSANFSSIISGVLSSVVSVGATVASGGTLAPLAVGALVNSATNSRLQIERGGGLGGNAGALAPKKPYIVVRRPVSKVTYQYNDIMGYPSSSRVVLGDVEGFVRVSHVNIDDVIATDREKQELETLLKGGVFI